MKESPWLAMIAVAIGGATGAVCRFGVGLLMARWHGAAAPLGTLFVNLAGCFLLGALMPWLLRDSVPAIYRALLVTGFCGGLTTFSTFGYEALWLARAAGRSDLAWGYIFSNLILGLGAVWIGERLALRYWGHD